MIADVTVDLLKALEAGYYLHLGSLLTAESNNGRIVPAHWVMKNLQPHLQTGTVIADVTVDLLKALEAGYCLHLGSLLMAESNDRRIVPAHKMQAYEIHTL